MPSSDSSAKRFRGSNWKTLITATLLSSSKANQASPRVVLDLKLSLVNGFDVLAWMRNEQKLRRVPVIVLSSSNQPADVKRAYDLGANSFLAKPVAFEALVNLVKGINQYWLTLNQGA